MSAKGLVMLLVLAGAGALALLSLPAPAHVGRESGFDTASAMRDLRFIAAQPRPRGSLHHRAVREFLVKRLSELGLEVQVQDTLVASRRMRGLKFQVLNVVARLRGTGGRAEAVALVAHYDSTPVAPAPGAGDDGAAVAALLEVARRLAIDPPLHDVIFLFTDGEESGMFGARAFVAEHPWRDDVAVLFNFEARGTSGPSIMFETSPGDAFLVDQYARAAPYPVTSSLGSTVYRLMPNDTDFTVFRHHGMQGLNFAFIGDYANYHSAADTVENLDPLSLRHHGVQALALARHFGQLDLSRLPRTGDAIYFNLLNLGVVRYPARWAMPLALLAAMLCGGAMLVAARRKAVTVAGTVWGLAMILLSMCLAAGAAAGVVRLLRPAPLDRHADVAVAGFALLALGCTNGIQRLFKNRSHPLECAAAAMIVWLLLAILSSVWVRGASYLFTLPLIVGAGSLAIVANLGRQRWDSWVATVVWALGGLAVVLLLTPVSYLAFLGLRIRLASVVIGIIILGLWALAAQLAIITGRRGWTATLLALSGAVACFGVATWL